MCECLEYDDGSMHLCEVDADIYREFTKSREAGLPWPLPEWMLDAILVHEKGVMAARQVAFREAAQIADQWASAQTAAAAIRTYAESQARIEDRP